MKKVVVIHGNKIAQSEFQNAINSCLQRKWSKQFWKPSQAIVYKNGNIELFNNQKFDQKNAELVEDAWDHDHCEICGWMLNDENVEERNTGYVDDNCNWICNECYINFIIQKQSGSK